MYFHPGLAGLDADFDHRWPVGRVQGLPDAIALAFLAHAFGIAGVIAEDFPGPVARRQLQHENLSTIERAIGAWRHAHLVEELAVKHRFRFEAGAEADLSDPIPARQQFLGRALDPHAPEPGNRRQMGMVAIEIAQLGQADARFPGQRRGIGEILRPRRNPFRQTLEQGHILVLAPVIKIRAAALAGAQAGGFRLGFGGEQPHIFRFWRTGGTGRQAVDARGHHPKDELAVEFALAGFSAVPGHGFGVFHG
jgi:hypothetical protein